MEKKPRWMKGDRFERRASIEVAAPPEKVFPLLCPVLEYDWIPDWSCEMVWSKSGLAERDAMFTTRMMPFGRELWTCIVYEPPLRIEYLFTHGTRAAVHLELALSAEGGGTTLDWTMRFTASSPLFAKLLRRKMSEEAFAAMVRDRDAQLATYFASRS